MDTPHGNQAPLPQRRKVDHAGAPNEPWMDGSAERMDALKQLVENITADEKDAAAKVAAAVALTTVVHHDLVIAADTDGMIVYSNMSELLGYEAGKIVGQPLSMLMPERFRAQHEQGFQRYVNSGERHFKSWRDVPITALHADGHEIHMLISFEDVSVLGRRMIVGVMKPDENEVDLRDLSDVRHLQQVIKEADVRADKVVQQITDRSEGGDGDT